MTPSGMLDESSSPNLAMVGKMRQEFKILYFK